LALDCEAFNVSGGHNAVIAFCDPMMKPMPPEMSQVSVPACTCDWDELSERHPRGEDRIRHHTKDSKF
jgi:hypothetical protein